MELISNVPKILRKEHPKKALVLSKTAELTDPTEIEKRAVTSILKAIDFGMKLSEQYCYEGSDNTPFFIENLQALSKPGELAFNPQVGVIAPGMGQIFSSTRESWNKLGHLNRNYPNRRYESLPAINGLVQFSGERVICIGRNFVGGSQFDHSIVGEEYKSIVLTESEKLIKHGDSSKDPDIPLTVKQMKELIEIFDDAYEKLRERELLFKEKIP